MFLAEQQELMQSCCVGVCVGSLPRMPLDSEDWMSMTIFSKLLVGQCRLVESLRARKPIKTMVYARLQPLLRNIGSTILWSQVKTILIHTWFCFWTIVQMLDYFAGWPGEPRSRGWRSSERVRLRDAGRWAGSCFRHRGRRSAGRCGGWGVAFLPCNPELLPSHFGFAPRPDLSSFRPFEILQTQSMCLPWGASRAPRPRADPTI